MVDALFDVGTEAGVREVDDHPKSLALDGLQAGEDFGGEGALGDEADRVRDALGGQGVEQLDEVGAVGRGGEGIGAGVEGEDGVAVVVRAREELGDRVLRGGHLDGLDEGLASVLEVAVPAVLRAALARVDRDPGLVLVDDRLVEAGHEGDALGHGCLPDRWMRTAMG
ncbi:MULTISPECIES: hypothetical protein [unclassified Streptomyces]|uniref:hypothetical protein n=1 Tax=unclassified Streptomyces TaxID=2593676 RepID=UPI0023B8DDC6|nr:hypothetical protein [Streptomyces sp. AM 3-1-1]WEH31257.1 hypothetical protein P0D76_30110 [Streptomyces sp. AM 3-1-1]